MGKIGNEAQSLLYGVYAVFGPGLAWMTSFTEPEKAGYRSDGKMEKAVVQLYFRPELEPKAKDVQLSKLLTHTSCFLQIIQCEMKVFKI